MKKKTLIPAKRLVGPLETRLIQEALSSLLRLKKRSALAFTGIVIGCVSIVSTLNIGNNAAHESLKLFKDLGTDVVIVNVAPSFEKNNTTHLNIIKNLADIKDANSNNFSLITPLVITSVSTGSTNQRKESTVIGAQPSIFDILSVRVKEGRLLNQYDINKTYIVVGANIAHSLELKLDSFFELKGYYYRVVGILSSKSNNPLLPFNLDEAIFMNVEGMSRMIQDPEISFFLGQARNSTNIESDSNHLKENLQRYFPERVLEVRIPKNLLDSIAKQSGMFTYLLFALGGLSLLGGGIGIMNVMTMSTNERKKEIGLRLAIGATPSDIRKMFLYESVGLSAVGSVAGAVIGLLIAFLYSVISNWDFVFFPSTVILGFTSSISTGILFGMRPAVAASKLTPAEALRDS